MRSRRGGGSWADSLQNMIGMNGDWKQYKSDDSVVTRTTKGGRRKAPSRKKAKASQRSKGVKRSRGHRTRTKTGKMRGGQDHWFTKLGVGVHKFEDPSGYMEETDRIPEYNVGLPNAVVLGRPRS